MGEQCGLTATVPRALDQKAAISKPRVGLLLNPRPMRARGHQIRLAHGNNDGKGAGMGQPRQLRKASIF